MPASPIRSRPPRSGRPPGRMLHDIWEDRILLHTIQTAEAFGALLTHGALNPDPALAEPPLHADGYDWMYRQMDARLPTSGDGALWLWARIRRQKLVELCGLAPGQVLLTCRVPRDRVLLPLRVMAGNSTCPACRRCRGGRPDRHFMPDRDLDELLKSPSAQEVCRGLSVGWFGKAGRG